MPNRTGITIAGESNPGLVRRHNEDNFVIVALPERSSILAVVAAGVGGHSNGGMASLICCRDLADAYFSIPDEELSTPLQAEKFLRDEIRVINRKIFERNYFEELRRPMGSTILAVLFLQDSLVMASAGDTRLYELPPDRPLRQLSVDHTLSAAYLRAHGRNPENRAVLRNVIMRAVGPRRELALDVRVFRKPAGARYLFCTDGAYRYSSDRQLREALEDAFVPRDTVSAVMRTALLRGGHDNITVIAAFVERGS